MRFADALGGIYGDIQELLRAATPAFTLRLARGLALAENPRNGESFGWDRCALVAEALVEKARAGQRIELEGVARRFARRGLTLDRPYLEEGSQQEYSLPVRRSNAAPARTAISSDRDVFLYTAVRIGDYLVRSAIWSREACNWIAELRTGACGALDPTLYSGASGIAWFLAELYRACGDERFRRTAIAALSHACRGVQSRRRAYGNGLYSGAAGVAYVAWRCASLLDRPNLLDESQRIFKRILRASGNCPAGDVISGEAGVILCARSNRLEWQRDRDARADSDRVGSTGAGYVFVADGEREAISEPDWVFAWDGGDRGGAAGGVRTDRTSRIPERRKRSDPV